MADWQFEERTLRGGQKISILAKPSSDTPTAVQLTAPLIDSLVQEASVIIRNNPTIRVADLRAELPKLSPYISDRRLAELIRYRGSVSFRKFTNDLIEDAAGPARRLSSKTVDWYRNHKSRQVKSSKRGRPRKSR